MGCKLIRHSKDGLLQLCLIKSSLNKCVAYLQVSPIACYAKIKLLFFFQSALCADNRSTCNTGNNIIVTVM